MDFSRLAKVMQEDHRKIREHSVKSLKEVLTIDKEHYGGLKDLANKMSDDDLENLLDIVGNIIYSKCRQVYNNEI